MKKFNDNNKLAVQMLVTSLNCAGDSVAAIAVAKSEGKLDMSAFQKEN